jgi:transcriptional regulator with XRE-family HTH domain
MHFSSDKLKEARNAAQLTQKQLAEQAGVGLRSLINWEQGDEPTQENLRKICNALHVDFHFFYTEAEEENSTGLHEHAPESEAELWKRRALSAERRLHNLENLLRSALEMSRETTPPPKEFRQGKVSSLAEEVSKDDVEAALNARMGKAGHHQPKDKA